MAGGICGLQFLLWEISNFEDTEDSVTYYVYHLHLTII